MRTHGYAEILNEYDYQFPHELIAQKPASPRDAARLLVYRRKTKRVHYGTFKDLPQLLPRHATLVFNETKVIPARLLVTKETGGRVELLYIETSQGLIKALANRKLTLHSKLSLTKQKYLTVKKSDSRFYYLAPSFPLKEFNALLQKYGRTPLPPYIKRHDVQDAVLRKRYQAVFAKIPGSIAAPTASLHFTDALIKRLRREKIDIHFVTLHVGLGTFAPITANQLQRGVLHEEYYEIPPETALAITQAKKAGRPVIAVGTTVVRTLESASNARGHITKRIGHTKLFIRPGYTFKIVDGIITNFHVPRSSLLMLISAFVSRKEIFSLYKKAMRKKFRFFSFGDGMLLD